MILAAGASGRLLPVVVALLARGHAVRVTARDPGSAIARQRAARGVEIVRADLDDPDSLRAAAAGADRVFAAGSPHQAGPAGEARQGINIAQAAAIGDLASVVALVVEDPDRFAGRRLELADELTGEQAAAALSRVTGRPFAFHEIPLAALPEGMARLVEWLQRVGHDVDIQALRNGLADIRWHRFDEWAARQAWPQGQNRLV